MSLALIVTPVYGHTLAAYYLHALFAHLGHKVECFDLEYAFVKQDPDGYRLLSKFLGTYDIGRFPNVDFIRRPWFVLKSLFPGAEWEDPGCYSQLEERILTSAKLFVQAVVERILARRYTTLLFPVLSGNLWFTLYLIQALRAGQYRGTVVLGGEGVSHPRVARLVQCLGLADLVIQADRFDAFADLIDSLHLGRLQSADIQSLIETNSLYPMPDGFPEPGLDFRSYGSTPLISKQFIPISASFGCRHGCEFCFDSKSSFYVRRSVDLVVREIVEQAKQHGSQLFGFCDPTLNSEPGWLEELCKTLLAEKVQAWFMFAHLRADLLDSGTANLMSRCGFRHVNLGIEALDDELCRDMHKAGNGYTQSVEGAIEQIATAGIPMSINVFSNYPGCSEEAFQRIMGRTSDLICRLSNDGLLGQTIFNVHPTRIDPHARLYQNRLCHQVRRIGLNLPASLAHLQPALDDVMENYESGEMAQEATRFEMLSTLVRNAVAQPYREVAPGTGRLPLSSRLEFQPGIEFSGRDLGDGYWLLTTNWGHQFRVNSLGIRILELLRQGRSISEVAEAIGGGEGMESEPGPQVEQVAVTLIAEAVAALATRPAMTS